MFWQPCWFEFCQLHCVRVQSLAVRRRRRRSPCFCLACCRGQMEDKRRSCCCKQASSQQHQQAKTTTGNNEEKSKLLGFMKHNDILQQSNYYQKLQIFKLRIKTNTEIIFTKQNPDKSFLFKQFMELNWSHKKI